MTTATTNPMACPLCGQKGKTVKPRTLRAVLIDEFVPQVAEVDYRFCEAPGCAVVYFGNGQTFTQAHLKVPVGIKETSGERPLCYCFGHSVATIKDELRTKGRSDALDDIGQKMDDPGCACAVKNPSGSCCLGSVGRGIETAKSELNTATPRGRKVEMMSHLGTVLSATLASSCCWLPLVLLALGVSGAGIAGTLESSRPVFSVLTFGFLAAAFYFTYRSPQATAASEDCCAAAPDCCATPPPSGKRRFNWMASNKVLLWGVTLLAVLFLFFPKYVGFFLTGMTDSTMGCCAKDSCEEPPAAGRGKTDARPIDPDRQIVFTVHGFT